MSGGDVVVLGASGRLGHALCAAHGQARLHRPDRAQVSAWLEGESVVDWLSQFEAPIQIHVALGVIDPHASTDDIQAINVDLPTQILRAASKLGHKVATYGSVMEAILPPGQRNAYIDSKVRLADQVQEAHASGTAAVHYRLHTLYGGKPPPPFMFAGQMLRALETQSPFEMTSGKQFREYHHVADEVAAILANPNDAGVVEVSNRAPIRLRDLAEGVFSAFDAQHLLHIGALQDPASDYYDASASPAVPVITGNFRPAQTGVADWYAELGLRSLPKTKKAGA